MKRKLILCAFIFISLYGLQPLLPVAMAAPAEEKAGMYSLGEVVVTGKNEGVEATGSVITITAEDIKDKNARTLDQALNLLPGLNVRTGGEGVPRIDIRGFKTRHIILLLNGVPMNSAVDGQFDPRMIPTENIAAIKVTTGANSVLYGQGGLGGVINIITKKGTKGLQGMVSGEVGDEERYLGRASVSGANDKVDFLLSGSTTKIGSFPLSDDFTPTSEQGKGNRLNSDVERSNVFGNFGFNPNEDLTLGLSLGYTEGEFGKPSSTIRNNSDPFASTPKYERIISSKGTSAQLAGSYEITKQFSLRSSAYINHSNEHSRGYDNANFNSFNLKNSYMQQTRTTIYGISLQPKYELGKLGTVTLALSGEKDDWDNEGFVNTNNSGSRSSLDASKSFNIYSAAIQYEVTPLKNLGFSAGFGQFWQNRSEMDLDDYSMLFGAYYDLFKDTRLKASYNRNIRFPSLGDLYSGTEGNPNLLAERSQTYEAGVEQKLPFSSALSLNVFSAKIDNYIQKDDVSGKNVNLGLERFKGFDVSASTQFVKRMLLRVSYTYLHSEDETRAGYDERQYTPRDKVTLEGKYDFDFGLSPYISILYVGNQYYYSKNSVTPVQKAKLGDYTLVNFKLTQSFWNRKLSVYAGADNIFDENYETSYAYPQAGRFIYGGTEIRF